MRHEIDGQFDECKRCGMPSDLIVHGSQLAECRAKGKLSREDWDKIRWLSDRGFLGWPPEAGEMSTSDGRGA